MRSRVIRGIKSRLSGLGQSDAKRSTESARISKSNSTKGQTTQKLSSPVEKFYSRLLNNNLGAFNSFALQSRSLRVRDVFARGASMGRHDFSSLLMEIDGVLQTNLKKHSSSFELPTYNRDILLSLANLLLNSARHDLDTQAGLQIFKLVVFKYGDDSLTSYHKLQYVEALAELGDYEEQATLLERLDIESLAPMQVELMNIDRIANQSSDKYEWLAAMNSLYSSLGMTTLALNDDDSLPLIDRLVSDTNLQVNGPKVSVIMPTFSPGPGIWTAIRSLLHQTWANIEIIVVDDGSPDEYSKTLTDIENLDSSIRVIRQSDNLGAYVVRNVGLAAATGEFVTTHDDDDWSHPEKISLQAGALVGNDALSATTSAHIRTSENMQFRRINTRPQHLQTNYSSLMFRKTVTDEIGDWDTVNRGGDSELAVRIQQNYGTSSILHLVDKPLSFSRVWSGSLTSGEMYRGYFAYSRLLYRWAFRQWHRTVRKSGTKPINHPDTPRPYAVPTTFEPGNRNKDLGLFDIIYVTDFAQQAKFADSVVSEIDSAVAAGLRVGYMHINSPQTPKRANIPLRLSELQLDRKVMQVAENNQAEAKLMVVYDASIGMFLDEFESSVIVRRGIVVDDKGVSLKSGERRDATHPRQVLQHFDNSFNTKFQIVGAAYQDSEKLRTELPQRRVLDDRFIWNTHVDLAAGPIAAPSGCPVVGYHSFGNKYRWPANRETFESVYSSAGHGLLFYGLIKPIMNEFGEDLISETNILDFRKHQLIDFLNSIDFWVYFPNERLEERLWQPVLSAMQAGKVVILPPHLKGIYGSAALYANAEEVASVVAAYSQDENMYISQAQRGQEFIANGFDRDSYVARVKELIAFEPVL